MRFPDEVAMRRLGAGAAAACLVSALLILALAVGVARRLVDGRAPDAFPVASVEGAQLDRGATLDPGLAATVQESVVRVEVTGCGERRQGSATLVDASGRLRAVTNQHVVAGARVASFRDPGGAERPVDGRNRVLERDAARLDAAELSDAGVPALPVGPQPVVGSGVVVAGYPGGRFRAETGRVVAVDRRQGYGGTVDMLIVDVEAMPGISGGVVVDGEGRAVAMVAARDPATGHTVAYPIDQVLGPTGPYDTRC
jgi:S1-C subfamily serine protease